MSSGTSLLTSRVPSVCGGLLSLAQRLQLVAGEAHKRKRRGAHRRAQLACGALPEAVALGEQRADARLAGPGDHRSKDAGGQLRPACVRAALERELQLELQRPRKAAAVEARRPRPVGGPQARGVGVRVAALEAPGAQRPAAPLVGIAEPPARHRREGAARREAAAAPGAGGSLARQEALELRLAASLEAHVVRRAEAAQVDRAPTVRHRALRGGTEREGPVAGGAAGQDQVVRLGHVDLGAELRPDLGQQHVRPRARWARCRRGLDHSSSASERSTPARSSSARRSSAEGCR